MAKDPAMLFYTSDFLTGVALMSMKERGQYITLLCLQQQRGHMTEQEMRKAVGTMSAELKAKFVQDADGLWFNRRAEEEIRKREAHCQKQRLNANRRWDMPNDTVGISHGNAMALPLENENEIEEDKRKSTKRSSTSQDKKDSQRERGSGGKGETPLSVFSAFAGDNSALLDALRGFSEMRQKIRKPLTARAAQMIVNKLRQLSDDPGEQIAILDQSVYHSWQGVFALHGRPAGAGEKPRARNGPVMQADTGRSWPDNRWMDEIDLETGLPRKAGRNG